MTEVQAFSNSALLFRVNCILKLVFLLAMAWLLAVIGAISPLVPIQQEKGRVTSGGLEEQGKTFPEIFSKTLLMFHQPEAYLMPVPEPTPGEEERTSPGPIKVMPRAEGGKDNFC